jgi:acid stress-induced BolA-like protein IbaG/YrbA
MVTPEQIKTWIEEGLQGSEVQVTGDGQHFDALVVSLEFDAKSLIARHRIVYNALGDRMKADIHALSLKTLTPEEYQG